MATTFKKRFWKTSKWFAGLFVSLFVFRLIYGYVETNTTVGNDYRDNFFSSIDKSKKLTLKEWKDFTEKINAIKFWDLPSTNNSMGFDASQWILEGKRLGKYHVVDRWGGGELKDVCKKLIKLTDLKLEDVY